VKHFLLLSLIISLIVAATSCATVSENERHFYAAGDQGWEITLPSSWKQEACRTPGRICFWDAERRGFMEISILKIPRIKVSTLADDFFRKSHYEITAVKHYTGKIWEGNIYYAGDDHGDQWLLAFLHFDDYLLFATFVTSEPAVMSGESGVVLDCLSNISRRVASPAVREDTI